MVWIVIIGLIVITIAALLITPLTIYFDSNERLAYVRLKWFFKLSGKLEEGKAKFYLNTPFYWGHVDPFQKGKTKTKAKKKVVKKEKPKPSQRSPWQVFRLIRDLIKTFELKSFIFNVDTDDYVLNAQLVPVMSILSRKNVHLSTNFHGEVHCHLELENRLHRCIGPALRFALKR
ncbi:MAG: hypothetical protein AAFX87_00965 [Bacteroidota bacterium]